MDTKRNALDFIKLSHRPRGELEWVEGPAPEDEAPEDNDAKTDDDTGTTHPHGKQQQYFDLLSVCSDEVTHRVLYSVANFRRNSIQ